MNLDRSAPPSLMDTDAAALEQACALALRLRQADDEGRVVELADAAALAALRGMPVPAQGRCLQEVVAEMAAQVYRHRAQADHPRFFAFVPGPASRLSALGDWMTGLYNPHAGNWLESSGPSCIEQRLVGWLAGQLGLPDSAGGLFVSGGSMANLTALVVARDQRLPAGRRPQGVAYVSEQTHSSVAKALRVIGFLPAQIRSVRCDAAFRMDPQALAGAIDDDLRAGLSPFAVVATAGTTNTGSIDPLPGIRRLCDRHGLWMHVDGAYGASIALSPPHRHLLEGLGSADSVSWDAHKWLFQTYGCGMVLLRDARHLPASFHTRPEYLRDTETGDGEVNFWDLGVELTRPARGLKLWLTLQAVGSDAVGAAIGHGVRLAGWAEDELRRHAGWEVVSPAQLAIVNFRHAPAGWADDAVDELNTRISRAMLEEGYATVLTTRLHGRTVLRICAIHPGATEADMRETVRRLDGHARRAVAAIDRSGCGSVPPLRSG